MTPWYMYLHKFVKQLKAFKNSNPISIRNRHNVELKKVFLRFKNIIWSFFFLIVWFKRWPNCHFEDWNIASWVELEFQPRKSLFGWENHEKFSSWLPSSLLGSPQTVLGPNTLCTFRILKFSRLFMMIWQKNLKWFFHFADSFQAVFSPNLKGQF